jgi:thiol-disulfide isomerase/thioredoxin
MQDIQEEQSGQAALLESIYLENGDHVSILPVVDTDGKNLSGPPIEKEMNLLVYLSDSCGGCLGSMDTLRDLMGVFGTDEIGYAYLYSNSVPRNLEEKYGISREYCYCLDENLMLATSLPTFYLVDGEGTVVFRTDKLELIIQKLIALEIVPQEKLVEQADAYLLERYFQAESDKQQIIYFAMKGCGDCEAADELIDSEEVGERYDVVRIYRDKTEEEGEAGDDFGLFREVYGISWYPSFEILRGSEREFVGEVSLGELERILMR